MTMGICQLPADGAPPINVTLPLITGATSVGSLLSSSVGTWLNNPTSFSYQWERDAVPIVGQTSATYTITGADAGHELTVAVTAYNAFGQATAASLPVLIPAGPPQETPGPHSAVIGAYEWPRKRRPLYDLDPFAAYDELRRRADEEALLVTGALE